MAFNSISFLLFFTPFFVGYWIIPSKFRWIYLLIGSYLFYVSWSPVYGLLLFLETIIAYYSSALLLKKKVQKSFILAVSVILLLIPLVTFKYLNFFISLIVPLFPTVVSPSPLMSWVLPVGISFYTFQAIGYLVDVYRGTIPSETHFGRFALFMAFFPQLLAGPIARAGHVLPQFLTPTRFSYKNSVNGLRLFTFGLFKKVVIADNLAKVVDSVFTSLPEFKGLSLVFVMVLYSWQIYTDFSGYTDMARGIARMLGINLQKNFDSPYVATSIRDFWRRWHQSLSFWFRDYLYIPLGGSRKGEWRTIVNTVIVFTVCGLWHGASLNFLLWGFFHGTAIAIERYTSKLPFTVPKFISIASTFSLITASWVLFRAPKLSDAWYIYKNALVGIKNIINPSYIWATLNQLFMTNRLEMVITGFCLVTIILLEWANRHQRLGFKFSQKPLPMRWITYTVMVFLIIMLRNADIKQFIYLQF